jgi:isocitrate dehydrogenase
MTTNGKPGAAGFGQGSSTGQGGVPIAVAMGDGIGPEIMKAVLSILEAAGARIAPQFIDIGEKVYLAGCSSGIEASSWDTLRRTKIFLKAPITTPQGGGYKSLNVTVRKTLGLYANVRPVQTFTPFVKSHFPKMDLVIVRENEEDLYAGIEHRQTQDVYQCLKLITRPGCERIIRYAFEYAASTGRKKVTCFSKDNIMKMTDGLFHRIFKEIAQEYPQIATEHQIIDIGSARLAASPERFDVIVTSNLYGDIISDIAAEVSGSVGLGASMNIGSECAMFEAIHGSAPDIAGLDVANPSGLLLAAVQMLVHVGQSDVAERIQNAWAKTLEEGVHTADIFQEGKSQKRVGTAAFAQAVVARLGQEPSQLKKTSFGSQATDPRGGQKGSITQRIDAALKRPAVAQKTLVGVDIFVDHPIAQGMTGQQAAAVLSEGLQRVIGNALQLSLITNRGVMIWPEGFPETFCVDHWRCRFLAPKGHSLSNSDVAQALARLAEAKIDAVKTENLYTFDGQLGYSLGQGE